MAKDEELVAYPHAPVDEGDVSGTGPEPDPAEVIGNTPGTDDARRAKRAVAPHPDPINRRNGVGYEYRTPIGDVHFVRVWRDWNALRDPVVPAVPAARTRVPADLRDELEARSENDRHEDE